MKALRRGWNRFTGMLTGRGGERELADEMASHIQMQTEDNLRAGMPPDEARRAAMLKFGSMESAKESYRNQRGLPLLESGWTDLHYAMRTLRNSPGFSVVAILTLAVGIGANTAIFSLVNQLLLHPAGIDHPERVLAVRTRDNTSSSPATFADLHASTAIFERVALSDGSGTGVNYAGGESPERLYAPGVSQEWFDVFGAKPLLGRVFTSEEDQLNRNRVVILSHAAWTRLFGADPSVVGRTIQLSQIPHQVIGIMKPDFRFPQGVDLWKPAGLPRALYDPNARFNERAFVVARLRPGVSQEKAQAWLDVLTDRVRNSDSKIGPAARNTAWKISVSPFADAVTGQKTALLLLLGAVALVLLIACSNIAGLMVARTSVRARELAVRSALGASRLRLVRQILSESLLLAAAGGVSGLAFASGAVRILRLLSTAPADLNAEIDLYVLVFCAGAALASGILFGLAPAWQVSGFHPQGALKTVGRSNTVDAGKQRIRSLLVVGETALALTLLVTAGLFIRSFMLLQSVNPGFEPRGVMTAIFAVPSATYPAVLEQVQAAPGVKAAGLVWPVPFSYNNQGGVFTIEGRVLGPDEPPPFADRRRVTPGYMEAMSIPLKRGRYFTSGDRNNSELVTVIDENLARKYWPSEEPLAQRIRVGRDVYTIVGVVGHVAHPDLDSDTGTGVYYLSLFQGERDGSVGIAVKTSGDLATTAAVVRGAVRAADPTQPVFSVRSMEDYVSASLSNRRFGVRVLGFFAATALFLAALGLYGVISYSVAQRTREIGIRIALGAERSSVMKLVVGQGLRLASAGVALGAGAAALTGRILESQLFQVSAFDPITILGMAAVLLGAGLLASYLPARRAVHVDPAVTLRYE